MSIEQIAANKSFGGWQNRFKHTASSLNCEMNFSIYLPPQVEDGIKVPVLYFLSGLTCNDENFAQKAAAQRIAAELGIAIVTPDTSPRGDGVTDDKDAAYDLGLGAGFYVNATQQPWAKHYQMYDYIVGELPKLIEQNFPVTDKKSISGHSMGGHGALSIGLKNPQDYASISAFSPICNPINCPWGQKAFENYLGADKTTWQAYDASRLIAIAEHKLPMMVELGLDDQFLEEQLGIDAFISAAKQNQYDVNIAQHKGYDHSYFFIASFIEAHLRFHAKYLA